MSNQLSTIVSLHRLLLEARGLDEQLAGLPAWMTDLHAEHTRAKSEIEALDEVAAAAGRERRNAESAIADIQEKLRQYQQQMSLVRNQREYGALLQEIDHAKANLRRLEEEALAALGKLEAAERDAVERRAGFGDLEGRYAAGLARWEEEKPALAARLAEVERLAAGLREALPRPARAQFERIFERLKGDALAPLRRTERLAGPGLWHCGACNYHVRPQVAVEIRVDGALVQCESCKRLLHPEEML